MIQKIKYGNSTIQYGIVRSKRRKTSEISVDPDSVIVRTLDTKSDSDVRKIVIQKAQWIFKKQMYFTRQNPDVSKITFAKNSSIPFKGKNYQIKIVLNSFQKVRVSGKEIEFHIPQKRHTKSQIQSMYQEWLKSKAQTYFEKIIQKYTDMVRVKPDKIIIKNLKDRWGSTTQKGEINLNSNLIKAPVHVINYVILHELCHLKIKEHSYHFWNLVSKYMPEYEKYIKWLEINGIRIT